MSIQNLLPQTQSELEALIKLNAPKLYFNNIEQYFMTSIEDFLEISYLVSSETKEQQQASIDNLPLGLEHEHKYYLSLKPDASRAGNLAAAKMYVHALVSTKENCIELQYWFLYAYNGHGTAYVDDTIDHTINGPVSLAPFGEHEGDWEHISVCYNLATKKLDSVYCSQHSGGMWYTPDQLEFEGDQLVIYSSLNGHASYPTPGRNFIYDANVKVEGIGVEFALINATDKGRSLDGRNAYELVAADFLDGFTEAKWVNFLNRWGAPVTAHANVRAILDAAIGTTLTNVLGAVNIVAVLENEAKEDQNGPTGPKMKSDWKGNEQSEELTIKQASEDTIKKYVDKGEAAVKEVTTLPRKAIHKTKKILKKGLDKIRSIFGI